MTNNTSKTSASMGRGANLQKALLMSENQPVVVYCAEFYKEYLVVCSHAINIYDTDKMTRVQRLSIKTHTASFVPFTNYLVFADGEHKRELVVYDYLTNAVTARVTLSFAI